MKVFTWYLCYFYLTVVFTVLSYRQFVKHLQFKISKVIIHQYKKMILSKKRKSKHQQQLPLLTSCITAPQETVVLKGRIKWSFNFSLFIVRGEITEVLPWGEQQRKVRPGGFNPRGRKVGNLLNSLFGPGGIQRENSLFCQIKEDSLRSLLNTGKVKLHIGLEYKC